MGFFAYAQYIWNGVDGNWQALESEAADDDKPGWTEADRQAYRCPDCGEDGNHCEHPWCTGRQSRPSDNN